MRATKRNMEQLEPSTFKKNYGEGHTLKVNKYRQLIYKFKLCYMRVHNSPPMANRVNAVVEIEIVCNIILYKTTVSILRNFVKDNVTKIIKLAVSIKILCSVQYI